MPKMISSSFTLGHAYTHIFFAGNSFLDEDDCNKGAVRIQLYL